MRGLQHVNRFPGGVSYLTAALLAASTIAYGQDSYSAPPPPPPANQQQPGVNGGGWRPVGGYSAPPAYNQPNNQPNYPAPPVPAQLTLAAGTYLPVRIDQSLSSDKNQPGDSFTATLEAPLVANGIVVAEPGEMLGGRVAVAEKHGSHRPGRLGVQLTSLALADGQQIPIQSQLVSRRGGTTPGAVEAGRVATTAGIGAVIGSAVGWGTGAAIGAAAGGMAGLIGVLETRHHASVIYSEQELTFRLQAPVTISTVNAPQAFHYIQPGEYDQPAPYANTAPAPPPRPTLYPYPYGWGYPFYGGPGFAAYWGPGFFWGRGYYGGYRGGFVHGRGFGYGRR
ncbi:MAG: hypothetical protein ACRD4O_05735 [Bryobacteraceae bacterium]